MSLLTGLKLIHLVGLMMGFGGAILADMLILRRAILAPIEKHTIDSVQHLSHIVLAGLGLLWVSGAALVYVRYSIDPNVLMNEKVWAKVAIVAILTINGFVVHNIALSYLQSRVGRQMFNPDLPRYMIGLTFVAAVSSVSWFVPFVLGVASEYNFTVPAMLILGVYASMIFMAWGAFYGLARFVSVPDTVLEHEESEQRALQAVLRHRVEQLAASRVLSHGRAESNAHVDLTGYATPKSEKLSDLIRRIEQFQSELTPAGSADKQRHAA